MSTTAETEKMLADMTRAEKAELLRWMVRDRGDDFPGIASAVSKVSLMSWVVFMYDSHADTFSVGAPSCLVPRVVTNPDGLEFVNALGVQPNLRCGGKCR